MLLVVDDDDDVLVLSLLVLVATGASMFDVEGMVTIGVYEMKPCGVV